MAELFDTQERIVPTWLAVSQYLVKQPGYTARNALLEISNPLKLTSADLAILKKVDAAMVANMNDLTIETVASTIFPQGLYTRYGRPDLYGHYQRVIDRARRAGTWGTYFDRMTRRTSPDGRAVNPLETLVEKLRTAASPKGRTYQSVFELCPTNPATELVEVEMGEELATYEPTHDANFLRGGPCLSHLSFKITGRTHVDLTAIYRSHHYCSRALGNLIGLSRLLRFAAQEANLSIGTLSCLSTHAELDLGSWGGPGHGRIAEGKAVLASL